MWKYILADAVVGLLWHFAGPWVGAVVLAAHLRLHPWRDKPIDWRFAWRSFVIKFYWHKTETGTRTGYDTYKVSCDWHGFGCLDGCRRQAKLAAWEAADAARAVPKAQLLSSKTSDTIR